MEFVKSARQSRYCTSVRTVIHARAVECCVSSDVPHSAARNALSMPRAMSSDDDAVCLVPERHAQPSVA
jgi:hypothetical protein